MATPLVFRDLKSFYSWRSLSDSQLKVGFVPTMGALHDGHKSLFAAAMRDCDIVVGSIFVNPTQFNNPDDLEKYPRTLGNDLELLSQVGADAVFVPSFENLYRDQFKYKVVESELSKQLCGAFRPGHFDGVLTVVMKLFNIVRPDRAYFGEKDFQQLELIRGMTAAFFMDVEIIGLPTIRESDGLAMSSRNVRLTPNDRMLAARFPEALRNAKTTEDAKSQLSNLGFQVDYVQDLHRRRLAAVHLGEVRLIDNVEL